MPTLLDAILDWIETPDWAASAEYLKEHSQLLSDDAVQVLAQLLAASQIGRNTSMARECMRHYVLLGLARRDGVAQAYSRLISNRTSE
jgi:hypothetical protein